jgi:DNA primase
MNCEKIKGKVSIRTVLESFNLFPVKENGKTGFYFALDREEKVPSLSVDYINNKAFDFGTGKNYDIISIVQQINKTSVSDALKYLEKFNFQPQEIDQKEEVRSNAKYEIIQVKEVKHPALVQYLKYRNVCDQIHFVKEIHYQINGKKFFGIGFVNDSGGYEIRNKYTKICLGKKDVTLIISGMDCKREVKIFEGFFDFLTYRNIQRGANEVSDYLVLNSTAMLFKAEELLKKYNIISLFLDNDSNGRLITDKLFNQYNDVRDCASIYTGFNDLNEWFCSSGRYCDY